ncbi:unnamed protein product [Lepidochelys kempii]
MPCCKGLEISFENPEAPTWGARMSADSDLLTHTLPQNQSEGHLVELILEFELLLFKRGSYFRSPLAVSDSGWPYTFPAIATRLRPNLWPLQPKTHTQALASPHKGSPVPKMLLQSRTRLEQRRPGERSWPRSACPWPAPLMEESSGSTTCIFPMLLHVRRTPALPRKQGEPPRSVLQKSKAQGLPISGGAT